MNLAIPLEEAEVKILGTSPDSIDLAEDRGRFGRLLDRLGIPQAPNGVARSYDEAKQVALQINYPVMVRPSYVLGGRAMEVVYNDAMLESYIARATTISPDHPILIDKFLDNAIEIDVDALSDGTNTYIGGIMEHIEAAGIHSGDSACVLPTKSLSKDILDTIKKYTHSLAKALKVKGLMNMQLAIKDNVVYLLEVNPRASRTVPFVSKATGVPLAKLAAKIMVGKSLPEVLPDFQTREHAKLPWTAVKEAVLPWAKFPGVNAILGPEMRSTGEVMGIDTDFPAAYAKSQAAADSPLPEKGTILVSLKNPHKEQAIQIGKRLAKMGFSLVGTTGTAEAFEKAGIAIKTVKKIAEGRPNVVDIITNREVALVINTPSGGRSQSDGSAIRQAATRSRIPIITTLSAAEAATTALEATKKESWTIKSIQDYYKEVHNLKKGKTPTKTSVK